MVIYDISTFDESVWEYFDGEGGAKSDFFRNHPWLSYMLFVIQIIGVLLNGSLVSLLQNNVRKYYRITANDFKNYVAF